MFPTLVMWLMSVRCDQAGCKWVPTVAPAEKPPLVHLHPLEVPTEVRPWTPKKTPATVPAKPPGERK